ncbi:MAG: aldehyde ferredoxin oxidoreductase C-terminal domain-containing protein, partial [Dehalococcoidales bacterium]|nr:aldehyde ferredoxin oxidoreductase C-terminal domain-containing protein [Dehalococcoidales bacterium]
MITGGYIGKILRVDLTSKKIVEEKLDENILKKFGGQIGIGVKMMYDEVPPEVKATDSGNRLIFITGPFTGTRIQAPANFEVISQNPLTGCHIAIGNSHGFWGPRLKFSGYDGLIVQGVAEKPVYLWIHDGECEIRDATGIWGKADTFETENIIKKEVGQDRASVLAIGPAGENLCAAAMIENEHGHIAAKGNIGIVMGAKHLKAIAVYGTKTVPVADPEKFRTVAKKWGKECLRGFVSMLNEAGTAATVAQIYDRGQLPIKNFTTSVFPGYETLTGQYLRKTFELKRNPCYGCSLKHCHMVTVTEGPYNGFVGEEPEYESLSNLGSNLGISDPGTVTWLADYVDRLGLDANWAGAVASWAIEAYEKDILTKDALGGLQLGWGDEKATAELLRRIAYREGIGDTLALGLKKGAERIGDKEAAAFAIHFKGETHHAHDPRAGGASQLLQLAVAGAGPRWESPGVRFDYTPEGKFKGIVVTPTVKLFHETLGVCMFGFMSVSLETMVEAYQALTGWPLSTDEALLIAERIENMQRAFNVRHGFKPEMDLDISPRLLEA